MPKERMLFQCCLCKKFYLHDHLRFMFGDGSLMCDKCQAEIRGSVKFYINGVEVNPDDFNQQVEE